HDGVIQQIGSPIDIYNEPINAFVANFIGESNILPGKMKGDYLVNFAGRDFACVDSGFADGESVDVVVRPEDIKLVAENDGQINGVVKSVVFKGVHYEMVIEQVSYNWLVHSTSFEKAGTQVNMRVGPDDIHIMKRVGGKDAEDD
ncbi:MAG: TOBE domain-containing protein, partial [Oscillospiraceae bacterium]|nr:TOBE domain-containing protein [Oscillospiraceae bacterium]